MTPLRATDLPALRAELVTFQRDHGAALYQEFIESGRQHIQPLLDAPAEGATYLADAEVRRLERAELFFVSSEMTDLARSAGHTLPEFSLYPEDLPAPYGLVVFERPIAGYEDRGGPVSIVAAGWGLWRYQAREPGEPSRLTRPGEVVRPDQEREALWLDLYSDRDGLIPSHPAAADLKGWLPRLVHDTEAQVPIGKQVQVTEADRQTSADYALTVRAVWLLMAQSLARVEPATFDRAARRRTARLRETPNVRVISLRRSERSSANGSVDRHYRHSWVVRGHWRMQWYPSRQDHKPVWVEAYVKGPEDAPLLGGDKVYALIR